MLIYRLPNLFGKWCRPNYNSAVATFCHNIAHDLPIQLNPADPEITLCYIDDLVNEFIAALEGEEHRRPDGFCVVPEVYTVRLHYMAELLQSFRAPNRSFHTRYETLSPANSTAPELPGERFSYHQDERRCPFFTESSRPPSGAGIGQYLRQYQATTGTSKNEKFLVVSGTGLIQFRPLDGAEILEYHVSGEKLEVVDIPPGYTHNIINLGQTDMVTIMWANEAFDPERPDTYYLEV